ncbi:MAG: AI-2E family transporter [Sandarakinorhabdus sp.]|nr:AI-2E family transporter [Sandarakinorhabdus sp.]
MIDKPPEADRSPPWLGDTAIRFAVVAALAIGCFRIAQPFIVVLIWAVLLAVMVWPLHLQLRRTLLGNGWSAALIGFAGILLLVAPAVAVVQSVAMSTMRVAKTHQGETLRLPDLPWLQSVPMAGVELERGWTEVQNDTPGTIARNAKLIEPVALWLGARASGLAMGFLHFIGAIAIAAVVLGYGDGLGRTANALVHRIARDPERGDTIIAVAIATINSVVVGVIGMAVVQAVLLGGSFFVVGVPFAGVLVMLLLVFGIVQIPSQLLSVPILAWVWSNSGVTPALLFGGWIIIVQVFDAAIKPFMLGRGLQVPVPIILIGVIGGALAAGLLGLFVGPVLLSIGYMLLLEWLGEPLPEVAGK